MLSLLPAGPAVGFLEPFGPEECAGPMVRKGARQGPGIRALAATSRDRPRQVKACAGFVLDGDKTSFAVSSAFEARPHLGRRQYRGWPEAASSKASKTTALAAPGCHDGSSRYRSRFGDCRQKYSSLRKACVDTGGRAGARRHWRCHSASKPETQSFVSGCPATRDSSRIRVNGMEEFARKRKSIPRL
jgi:hypothetical protein